MLAKPFKGQKGGKQATSMLVSDSMSGKSESEKAVEEMTFAEFLANYPPGHGKPVLVTDATVFNSKVHYDGGVALSIIYPEIKLWCASDGCSGIRSFAVSGNPNTDLFEGSCVTEILYYRCKDCEKKCNVIVFRLTYEEGKTLAHKVGVFPPFRPRVPNQVQRLFQDQAQLFKNARSSENQGLGIGAFAYYRQLVEKAKDQLIDEIVKVAQKEQAGAELVKKLQAAKKEKQFTTAIENIAAALPDSLNIEGHNPLTILHQALSQGLHAQTDEECLVLAKNIRVVLTELADRIAQVKQDHSELKQAVSSLMR